MSQSNEPWVLMGSSFGGLTAAWMENRANPAQQDKVEALVLLGPAFQFLAQWLPRF